MTQPEPHRSVCLFCECPLASGRSKEHVFPQWLLEHLCVGDVAISPTHYGSDGSVKSTRDHSLDALQEGRVCTDCNTGWMSQLENDSSPILTHLFRAGRAPVDLEPHERVQIARWAAKTAYVLNSASNFDQHVPAEHYRYLRTHADSLPNDVVVLAQQQSGDESFYWHQGAIWRVRGHDLAEIEALCGSTYKISLQLRHLLLLVAWWPHPGWRYVLWRGIHVPLWPRTGPVAWYDSSASSFPWRDAVKALITFHVSLELMQEPEPASTSDANTAGLK